MKWVCPVCGYVHEGPEPPEKCPVCKVPGSKFVKQESATVDAFRGWFTAVNISSLTLPSIAIGNAETTRIEDIRESKGVRKDDAWYTLDGRRLNGKPTRKGLYIVNGRKQICYE